MSQDSRVPEYLLERLARNDLPADEAARVRARLQAEPGGAERLAALAASDREILARLPPRVVAAEVQRRAAATARPRFALVPYAALGVAGMLALFVGVRALDKPVAPAGDPVVVQPVEKEATTSKGLRPQLLVYRKQGDRPERLDNGARVRRGDRLQISYVAGAARYGIIVSVDARGTVSLHLPEAPGPAPELEGKAETALPHAFELDETPGAERFVFLASATPFSTAQVLEALRPGGAPLPSEIFQAEHTLRKETP